MCIPRRLSHHSWNIPHLHHIHHCSLDNYLKGVHRKNVHQFWNIVLWAPKYYQCRQLLSQILYLCNHSYKYIWLHRLSHHENKSLDNHIHRSWLDNYLKRVYRSRTDQFMALDWFLVLIDTCAYDSWVRTSVRVASLANTYDDVFWGIIWAKRICIAATIIHLTCFW